MASRRNFKKNSGLAGNNKTFHALKEVPFP